MTRKALAAAWHARRQGPQLVFPQVRFPISCTWRRRRTGFGSRDCLASSVPPSIRTRSCLGTGLGCGRTCRRTRLLTKVQKSHLPFSVRNPIMIDLRVVEGLLPMFCMARNYFEMR